MLSYLADMDIKTNPFELGLDRLVDLDKDFEFIGKDSLRQIKTEGVKRLQVGLNLEGPPLLHPNTRFWGIEQGGEKIGKVTSAVFSPRLKQNIALAIVLVEASEIGTKLIVQTNHGARKASVVNKPFYDLKKSLVLS
jgi:glycine cleavage system aminomethyltransferase T